uniref:Uncharacterized protein n=1 Tax=Siphoviridae sp. ctyvQ1 TaxID=2826525 RepID=A0A8S5QZQ0_9CAUD|nr:MAG TPA: hypothetical protein [Siphoviridae sp. ctyvQ1]
MKTLDKRFFLSIILYRNQSRLVHEKRLLFTKKN